MTRLSVFLITKNEAQDLSACLESVKEIAQEIIMVDDESTDGTRDIGQRFGARVLTRKLESFSTQKQFALDQTTGDWALSIDADERLTPALREEIQQILNSSAAADGYDIRRIFYFLGQPLRYGGLGHDWVLRLFRRSKGRYKPVRVHESIHVEGRVARLQNPMDHYSYATLAEYLEKCHRYTTLAAQDLWTQGCRFSVFDHLRPGWELLQRVVLRGAWLDGQPGLIYAALSAHAAWLRAIKLRELEQVRNGERGMRKKETL